MPSGEFNMKNLDFKKNNELTIGIELELQLINLQSFNLAMEAKDFLRRLSKRNCPGEIKPEITQSMIETNSSVHASYTSLLSELKIMRDLIVIEASKTHIGVCGGGTHPFQHWKKQRISHTERFASVSEQYGYLAKQFTVFGQHIHIACENGDDALYLCHALARYIPQFIALAAASPFSQGIDTSFDCSRLAVISAFPLSGTPPWMEKWDEFEEYYQKMQELGIVTSMKDFYWDIRPKPEFGTVELRICDTPLTVDKACQLAAYFQLLSYWLLEPRPPLSRDIYLTYLINRFRAARYGIEAILIDPIQQQKKPLQEDILQTCAMLNPYAEKLGSMEALISIQAAVDKNQNDAAWLKSRYTNRRCHSDLVRDQVALWKR